MAGAGYKLFNTGDVLTAAQVNTYLNEQTVMVFANAAARTSALTSVLAEGMVSYLQDTNAVEVYNGSAWVGVSGAGDVTEVQAGVGISVASGTGPIPVVTNTMATAVDAKGDLIVGTGADTFARLAVGTNGHTLVADSSETTGLKWVPGGNTNGVSVKTTSATAAGSGVYTDIAFQAEYFDTDAYHDNSTNNSRLTVPSGLAGYYYVTATLFVSSGAAALNPILRLAKNAAAETRWGINYIVANDRITIKADGIFYLAATDYMKAQIYQATGTNRDVDAADGQGHFSMFRIGA